MNLLLVNDDGVFAEGIHALARELKKKHKVIIVAPSSERSGHGHFITIKKSLDLKEVNIDTVTDENCIAYSCSGTPADCAKVGLLYLTKKLNIKFDALISGINHGSNIATDCFYSGTLGAAREARFNLIPSLAVSLTPKNMEFAPSAARYASKLIDMGLIFEMPEYTLLNLNVPALPLDQIKGIKIVRQGFINYTDHFEENSDGTITLIGPSLEKQRRDMGWYDEFCARDDRYCSLTPMLCDCTDFHTFEKIKDLGIIEL